MQLKQIIHFALFAVLLTAFSSSRLLADDAPDIEKMTAAELAEFMGSDADSSRRSLAAERLASLMEKMTAGELGALLGSDIPDWPKSLAVYQLESRGLDAADALPGVTKFLEDDISNRGMHAFWCLRNLGPDAAPAVPVLVRFLGISNKRDIVGDFGPVPDAGFDAAEVLGSIGPEALPALRERVGDKEPLVRMNVATALGKMGAAARPAVPDLLKLLKDKESYVRRDAVVALPNVAPDDPAVAAALIDVVNRDENEVVRFRAIQALRKLGPPSKDTIATAVRLLKSDDDFVRAEAAGLLGQTETGVEAVVAVLRKGFKDGPQYESVCALGDLGPAAAEALPDLLKEIDTRHYEPHGESDRPPKDDYIAEAAIRAAVKIAPTDPRTIQMLAKSIADPRHTIVAAQELATLGAPAAAAVPAVRRRLNQNGDLREDERLWLTTALLRLDPKAEGIEYERLVLKTFESSEYLFLHAPEWRLIIDAYRDSTHKIEPLASHIIRLYKEYDAAMEERCRKEEEAMRAGTWGNFDYSLPEGIVEICCGEFAKTMACFGSKGEPAVPVLIAELDRGWFHDDIIPALRAITGGDHPLITKALDDPEPWTRAGAAAVLGASDKAVPLLAKALDDPSARVRLAAVKSLAEILGRGVAEAKGPLEKALQDKRKSIRVVAERAVGEFDTEPTK